MNDYIYMDYYPNEMKRWDVYKKRKNGYQYLHSIDTHLAIRQFEDGKFKLKPSLINQDIMNIIWIEKHIKELKNKKNQRFQVDEDFRGIVNNSRLNLIYNSKNKSWYSIEVGRNANSAVIVSIYKAKKIYNSKNFNRIISGQKQAEIDFNTVLEQKTFNLDEDKYIDEIKEYIKDTYKEHYTKDDGKQVIEEIINDGYGLGFSLGNVKKYASRFGKKDGYNRKDLIKMIHYGIFALISHDRDNIKDEDSF